MSPPLSVGFSSIVLAFSSRMSPVVLALLGTATIGLGLRMKLQREGAEVVEVEGELAWVPKGLLAWTVLVDQSADTTSVEGLPSM